MFKRAKTRLMMFNNYKLITLIGYMKSICKNPNILKTREYCKTVLEKYEQIKDYHVRMRLFKKFIKHYKLIRIQGSLLYLNKSD